MNTCFAYPGRLTRCSLALIVLIAAGCKPPEEKTDPGQTSDQAAANVQIDDLRSLPYTGDTGKSPDEPSGVIRIDRERSFPGLNLYSVQMLGLAELMDNDGTVINRWRYGDRDRWENCELAPNGDLLVVGAERRKKATGDKPNRGIDDDARYLLRLSWDNELIWKKSITAHHDVEITPDGKLLVLTFERVSVPQIHDKVPVRDDHLTLLNEHGELIASKSMLQAVNQSAQVFPLYGVGVTSLGVEPWVDIFHANSIERMHHKKLAAKHAIYDLDNILVCYRHQDRIAVFNWPENKVIWTWGWEKISGPHDAQVLDNGNILLFDNGLKRGWSRAIELDPVSGDIVWQYKSDPPEDFYTRSKGSVQRLPNGNTLMAESDEGRAFEVTVGGEIVWEFLCPHETAPNRRAAIVRMKRYPQSFIDAVRESNH